jgi:AraC-like DNA-binding protein
LDPRIRIALRIIEDQPTNCGVSLTAISELLGLSQTHFRHLFKLNTGKALSQYLREQTMTRAGRLVEQQYDLPIKEIASQYGYDDVSNFYRDFKKVHGMTPKVLRVRHLQSLFQATLPLLRANELRRNMPEHNDNKVDPEFRRSDLGDGVFIP